MSLLVDTNVVSELMCRSPDPAVADWAATRSLHELFFSAVGEAELRYGAAILAARACADIAARCRSAGRPIAPADGQIAAIARSRGMALATRNVRDFEDIGIEVVDPWTAA